MKKNIHPKYFEEATITCACGQAFKAGSTLSEVKVETCSKCHPFYTGRQKLTDTGRVKRFESILKAAQTAKKQTNPKPKKTKKTKAKAKSK